MRSLAPDTDTLERVARALASVPRTAYSVPHVYPSAAPAYESAPEAVRPRPRRDRLRLYAHIPFCRYHCTFCYYAVNVGAGGAMMSRYVDALERELDWIEPGTSLSQLFVGGGTPTALPPELLDRALEAVFSRTRPLPQIVHTVETSPETISPAHVEALRRRGIGRVSMGIQSFDQDVLDTVHRNQSQAQAVAACELLVASGLIANVDLIYGLPGQSEEAFVADLRTLARLGIPSLTLYSLRTNERTPVVRSLRSTERFDLAGLIHWRALVKRSAEELGYSQTRWHTFKRLDSIARTHERLPCFDEEMSGFQLGVGMSARSHLGYAVYRNHEQLKTYVDRIEHGQSPVEQMFVLDEDDRRTQFVARTIGDGKTLRRSMYARTFGRPIEGDFGSLLERLAWAGLVEDDGESIALTELGVLVYDLVTLAFYPQRARDWLAARGGWLASARAAASAP